MIDDHIIKAVTTIANARRKKEYPLTGENHYDIADGRYFCEAMYDLSEKILEKENA